jgi:hypothetical protein
VFLEGDVLYFLEKEKGVGYTFVDVQNQTKGDRYAMSKRIPPSQEIWQGRNGPPRRKGSSEHPMDSFVEQSAPYVLQVAVEKEVSEYLGRVPYERRGMDGGGYRNGYEAKGIATEAGRVSVKVPQRGGP